MSINRTTVLIPKMTCMLDVGDSDDSCYLDVIGVNVDELSRCLTVNNMQHLIAIFSDKIIIHNYVNPSDDITEIDICANGGLIQINNPVDELL